MNDTILTKKKLKYLQNILDIQEESAHEDEYMRGMWNGMELMMAICLVMYDIPQGLDPTFYHTNTYEGDVKLRNKLKKILI